MSLATWTQFADDAPALAAAGRRLLERSGTGEGLLATIRDGTPPRIHPVILAVIEGRLLTFVIEGSAKDRDLLEDGRYALHALFDSAAPQELLVRGLAAPVADPALHAAATAAWPFNVTDGGYRLVELGIAHVLLGERSSADAWPPRYRSWRPTPG